MSPSVLRRNLGFLAGVVALSSVVACSDDTTSPAVATDAAATDSAAHEASVSDAAVDTSSEAAVVVEAGSEAAVLDGGNEAAVVDGGNEAAVGDGGGEAAVGDGGGEAAVVGDGGGEAAVRDGGGEAAVVGDGGGEAAAKDAGSDVTVVDAGGDVTVVGDGGAGDVTVGDVTVGDVTVSDGGVVGDVVVAEAAAGDGAVGDAAAAPVFDCVFGAADAGALCQVSASTAGWQYKGSATADGGTLTGAGLVVAAPTDASPGALEWTVPFTGPGQSSQILLWTDKPGVDALGKTLTFQVKGLVPVTNDPSNPGYWELILQSDVANPDGGADIWGWNQVVATWTNPSGTLVIPDGGVGAVQSLPFDLSGVPASDIDLTHLTTVTLNLKTPDVTAVDAGVMYSTANVAIESVVIQ